jgi:hypothetical protein
MPQAGRPKRNNTCTHKASHLLPAGEGQGGGVGGRASCTHAGQRSAPHTADATWPKTLHTRAVAAPHESCTGVPLARWVATAPAAPKQHAAHRRACCHSPHAPRQRQNAARPVRLSVLAPPAHTKLHRHTTLACLVACAHPKRPDTGCSRRSARPHQRATHPTGAACAPRARARAPWRIQ